jgi:hypothetical protein
VNHLMLAVLLIVLTACGSASAPGTNQGLTDAEKAWCPDFIPAIYRAGMRIGATPPPDLPVVQAIDQELKAEFPREEITDSMRYGILAAGSGRGDIGAYQLFDAQQTLKADWQRTSPDSYNRACKAAFAGRTGGP